MPGNKKPASKSRAVGGSGMGKVCPHPALFLRGLPGDVRAKALRELKAILQSNPGDIFNALTFWARQSSFAPVRVRLNEWFEKINPTLWG